MTAAVLLIWLAVFAAEAALALRRCGSLSEAATLLWRVDAGVLERCGGLTLVRVWLDGEWWRLVSGGLVHGSLLHLAVNALALASLGAWSERAWGSHRMAVILLLGSTAGCAASTAWAEAPLVVGGSAGCFALGVGLWVGARRGPPPVRSTLRAVSSRSLGFWLVLWLAAGWFVPGLANAGHLGGAVLGGVTTAVWALCRRFCTMAFFVAVLVTGLLGLAAAAPTHRTGYHAFLGYEALERDSAAAAAHLEAALAGRPDDPALMNAAAWAYALSGQNLGRALELAESAVDGLPDQADALDTLAWVHCRRGSVDTGLAILERAAAATERPFLELIVHRGACRFAATRDVSRGTDGA